jgi:hypothetical protein
MTLPAAAQGGQGRGPGGPPDRGQNRPSVSGRRSGDSPRRGPGPHAGDWLRKNFNLPPAEQERALENDEQFKQLSPQDRERLKQRLSRFNSLPPQEKQRWLNRMAWFDHLSPEQRAKANQVHQQMQSIAPQRRQAMYQALAGMRNLTPDQRQKMIDSDQVKNQFSEQERQAMHGISDIGLPNEDGGPPPE